MRFWDFRRGFVTLHQFASGSASFRGSQPCVGAAGRDHHRGKTDQAASNASTVAASITLLVGQPKDDQSKNQGTLHRTEVGSSGFVRIMFTQ